jgi:radical SAM superfamily enzyme YgiQ (UPF0313 family)
MKNNSTKNNPAVPDKSILFEPVRDVYGSRLALVFGNEFNKGECPFYQTQCYHCDIGAGEGVQFNYKLNIQRLEFFQAYHKNTLPDTTHLIIYNSGSVLNQKEMSKETLKKILDYAYSLEKCKVISFDSREMFVNNENLNYLLENLREEQQVRIILGIESQSDDVRIGKLKKNMTKQSIEKAFETIGKYNRKIGVDVNIVFQVPGLMGEEAIKEAVKTAEYGLSLGEKYDIPVDFNFHAYYQTKKSRGKYPKHPRADLKNGVKALILIRELVKARKSDAKVFIGWQDEEHDQEQEKRKSELDKYKDLFYQFNINNKIELNIPLFLSDLP